jgi:adenine/guanine phosphoribosyltransferase-like PRPP-binding protein
MSRSLSGNEITKVTTEDNNDYFSERFIFKNREAAKRLADKLKFLVKPTSELIILAIPRGGVVTGDVVASGLGASLSRNRTSTETNRVCDCCVFVFFVFLL